jgi:hypothetical protein
MAGRPLRRLRVEQASPGVRTVAFRRWFGKSKVVDGDGLPLVVYHGTPASDFYEFRHGVGEETDSGYAGKGFYFTNDEKLAEWYAKGKGFHARRTKKPRVISAYLRIERPYVVSGAAGNDLPDLPGMPPYTEDDLNEVGQLLLTQKQAARVRSTLLSLGYDGVIAYGGREIVVFFPEQIKSATENIGTYDPNDPDIRYNPRR